MADLFAGTPIAKAFKTDPEKENRGVWREHDSGICVRIRRASRDEYKRALRKFFKPFSHLTNVDPKDERLVRQKAAAQEIVADWGVRAPIPEDATEEQIAELSRPLDPMKAKEDGQVVPLSAADGSEIRCTEENALKAFVEQNDFYEWVFDEAQTFEHYRLAVVEEAGGNSRGGSAGSESGAQA